MLQICFGNLKISLTEVEARAAKKKNTLQPQFVLRLSSPEEEVKDFGLVVELSSALRAIGYASCWLASYHRQGERGDGRETLCSFYVMFKLVAEHALKQKTFTENTKLHKALSREKKRNEKKVREKCRKVFVS